MSDDDRHLLACIELAEQAAGRGNFPFAALLVDAEGRVLAQAENTVATEGDCTGHAELNLMRDASRRLDRDLLATCTVYASAEPCAMCAAAIYWGNVRRVVFALSCETAAGDRRRRAPDADADDRLPGGVRPERLPHRRPRPVPRGRGPGRRTTGTGPRRSRRPSRRRVAMALTDVASRVPFGLEDRRPWMELDFPQAEYERRVARIQELMGRDGLDAMILYGGTTSESNVRYVSGFTSFWGDSLVLVPARGAPVLTTNAIFHGEPMHSNIQSTWLEDIRPLLNRHSTANPLSIVDVAHGVLSDWGVAARPHRARRRPRRHRPSSTTSCGRSSPRRSSSTRRTRSGGCAASRARPRSR